MAIKHGKTIQFNYKTLRISQKQFSNLTFQMVIENVCQISQKLLTVYKTYFTRFTKNVSTKNKTNFNLSKEHKLNIQTKQQKYP